MRLPCRSNKINRLTVDSFSSDNCQTINFMHKQD